LLCKHVSEIYCLNFVVVAEILQNISGPEVLFQDLRRDEIRG